MKQTKVRIVGDLLIVDYCSKKIIDEAEDAEEAFHDNYYETGAWDSLTTLYVDDNEEQNLIKQKGKYIKTKEYFHNKFSEDGEHPLPIEIHYRYWSGQELEYIVELEDDEEFDIKKVQLIKSDYECDQFPYFILCEKILYDGKDVWANDEFNTWTEYCPEEKLYSEDTITSLYD